MRNLRAIILGGWGLLFGPVCPGAITIGIATAKHLIEGVILLCTDAANGSVGVSAMMHVIPDRYLLGATLLVCAGLAMSAERSHGHSPQTIFFLLVPQQLFLAATCLGACTAVWSGTYADGVARPGEFILCDQIVRILLAPAYTWALFARAGYVLQSTRNSARSCG